MATELRESGISPVGRVPWGTHFCHFFETTEDLLDTLVPYFKAGVEGGEFCIWVVSEPLSLEEAKSALRKAVPDFNRYVAEESIEFIPRSEWFFEGRTLDLPGVIQRFTEKLNQALARGYAGLRVNGSTAWLDDRREGLYYEFEKELDSLIHNRRMIVSCAFQLATSGAGQLLDAARTHQFAVARRHGKWEIVEIPELKQSKEEIWRMNEELEQRVAERTRELEAANEELRREITERKQVENELGERVKELTALHGISRALQQEWPDTKVLLGEVTLLLPPAFQYPEVTAVRLRIGQTTAETPGFSESPAVLQADFTTIDRQPGSVQVIYTEDRPHRFDGPFLSEEQALINTVADMLCIAYNRRQAEEAEREQRVLAEALRDTAAALSSTLDVEKVLDRILENVGLVVPHETSRIVLIEGDHWRVVRHRGFIERGLGEWIEGLHGRISESPLFARAVQATLPLVVHDTQASPAWIPLPQIAWIRSLIRAPIHVRGRVIGLLNLDSSIPGFFTDSHAARLQAFSDQAAIALENARLLEEVHSAHQRLQALSAQLLVAQETERRSIARELHDEIGQVLTAVGTNLQAIVPTAEPAMLSKRIEESLDLIDDALRQIRDLSLELRPSLLDDFGIVPALKWYIDRQSQRSGLAAGFVAEPPDIRLPPNLETTCFRVVQISLTNAARHARAKQVSVELRSLDGEVELVIRDDGVGFDVRAALERAAQGATLGLLSLQERVRLARGVLDIKSAPGHGTEIRARFPLD